MNERLKDEDDIIKNMNERLKDEDIWIK